MKNISSVSKKISDLILTSELNQNDVARIVDSLKMKKYIVSAILPNTPESETFGHFLERFWDWDKSPYVFEKKAVGQSIHKRYVQIMLRRAKTYWIPKFGNLPLGQITVELIKKQLKNLATTPQSVGTTKKDCFGNQVFDKRKLKAETVNQVVKAATLPLKWAFHNKLTKNDCFSGIMWCKVVPEKRVVPTMTQAEQIFSADWENQSSCLANLISVCTGMRIGEVQALQLKDIGKDRIFVRHNWTRGDGLKCPKNGEQREILVNESLLNLIKKHAEKNPYGPNPSNFLFWGINRETPCRSGNWNIELHKITKNLNFDKSQKITFHCWRHFFATNMADNTDLRKLQLATGHKSLAMLEHYARHESELTLKELGQISNKLFEPIINQTHKNF